MDEKKSVLTNNQAVENLEQDFQFANGVIDNASDGAIKQYNRDILLQLRLHPLSLQKPKELPEMEIIKDKLYLNDITDMTSTSEKHMDTSNYHLPMKPEYCSVKPDFPLAPPYLSRMYPYCYSSNGYNGPYQSAPLKCRSPFNSYCNPLKKHCMATHTHCLKDFSLEECSWLKHFSPSDEMWNCYSSHVPSGTYKKKENLDAVPKSKKKLPIIDPVTGKNVLETVHSNEAEHFLVGENSNSVENQMDTQEICGEHFSNIKENEETPAFKSDKKSCDSLHSSGDKKNTEELKDSDNEFQPEASTNSLKNNLKEKNDSTSTVVKNDDTECKNKKDENIFSETKDKISDFTKTSDKTYKYDASKYSKQMHISQSSHNRDLNSHFDVHSNCRAHPVKDSHMHACNENLSKLHETVQENLRQLREKIYSLKQEEQKVAILQNFFRYKKYQLEESARNLDEKGIEIANWEYYLYNKAKKLHEKEQWLENKNEMLNNKTQQLVEKEKMLNEEDKISGNTVYSNTFKAAEIPEKKFSFPNNDTIWSEISKMKNPRIDENNQYSFVNYDSKAGKISESIASNAEKCKSDAFSLNELEKNLAFIERMHSSEDVNDSSVGKIEMAPPPNRNQKNDESTSYDPLEYSKGRHYLPEHIKYWLDKREKNAL